MKLSRGRNWIQFDFDKKGHKGIFIGPLYSNERDAQGVYRFKLLSIMTRRFKLRLIKDRHEAKWELNFGGMWSSEGTKDEFINYQLSVGSLSAWEKRKEQDAIEEPAKEEKKEEAVITAPPAPRVRSIGIFD